jgi:hypothetical protein
MQNIKLWIMHCNKIELKIKIYVNKKFWEELIAYVTWYDTDRIENDASNNCSIVAYVFVAAVVFTEPLRSNAKGIHT